MQNHFHAQRGNVSLEFALVLPMLMAVMGMTIYFGMYCYTRVNLQRAADAIGQHCARRPTYYDSGAATPDRGNCVTSLEPSAFYGFPGRFPACGARPTVRSNSRTVDSTEHMAVLVVRVNCPMRGMGFLAAGNLTQPTYELAAQVSELFFTQ